MKWEPPAPKMKEVVLALRAVWHNWQEGTKLDFQGKFFRLSLMTPFFSPAPIEHHTIPVYLAGVNEGMCKLAGAVADGFHVHPLHTVRYLQEVIEPALKSGAEKSGRRRGEIQVAVSVFGAVGSTKPEIEALKQVYREQIAFYASTRTYRRVLDLHHWGDVGDRLHALSAKGDWQKMPLEVGDDMMKEFVVEGSWSEMGSILKSRYEGLADRVRLYTPFDGSAQWRTFVLSFRA